MVIKDYAVAEVEVVQGLTGLQGNREIGMFILSFINIVTLDFSYSLRMIAMHFTTPLTVYYVHYI